MRKNFEELLKKLYDCLKHEELQSIPQIANQIKSHYDTVKNYIALIEFIQKKPRIVVERTSNNKIFVKLEQEKVEKRD